MAVKSQIDINVNSNEFDALKTAFDKYASALKQTPAAWQNVGRASSSAKTNFESIADNMKLVGSSLAAITTSSKEFYQVTTATARHWKDLALSTKDVAKHILRATESLLKWGGILSLVTGGAGLWGFDRLAHSVSSQRSAALGSGTTFGNRAAFITNFRTFGDPEGLLGRIAEAQADLRQRSALMRLGLTKEDIEGDSTEATIKALRGGARRAAQDKASGTPVGSDAWLELFSGPERIRLRDNPQEIEERIAKLRADQTSGRFNLDPEQQKAYQDFTTKMEAAGKEIETVFVKGLVDLAGPLEGLSDAVVKLVEKFTDKALPTFIADLVVGIDWLAKEVTKDSFVKKVEGVVGMIGSLAGYLGWIVGGLAKFARWLGVTDFTAGAVDFTSGTQPGSGRGGETSLANPKYHGGEGAGGRRGLSARSGGPSWAGNSPENTAAAMVAAKDQLRQEGVPEANLDNAAAALVGNAIAESQLNPRAVHDNNTGYGIYGARLERRTGMLNWLSEHGYPKDSLEGQQRYMAHEAMTNPAYAATRNALRNATDATTAGDVVERNFEVPKLFNNRHAAISQAREAGKAKVSIQPVPGGNTSLGSGAAAAGSP